MGTRSQIFGRTLTSCHNVHWPEKFIQEKTGDLTPVLSSKLFCILWTISTW